MISRRPTKCRTHAFTLLELMTIVIVVCILIVMLFPVYSQIERRVERSHCVANLRNLHVAANLYLQEHRMWPQIGTKGVDTATVATNWINTLQPYGLTQLDWICPTTQKLLQNPDFSDPANARIDYIATPFDRNPLTPMRWAAQPWFIEAGDVHGNGNLMVFPDGHVQEVADLLAAAQKQSSASQ